MKKLMILAAAAALSACTANQSKVLVLYYSQTGATKAVAEEIANSLGADIEGFDVEQPYDGDFQQTIGRCIQERETNTLSPAIPIKADVSKYDVVFIGYPVWFGVAARPVLSLAESEKFSGKKVVTFCTFGSGGLESSTAHLAELLPEAEVVEGFGVRNARLGKAPAEIEKFLINAGFKEGEKEVLPEFSQKTDCTPIEEKIFNDACGSYEMPLGDPVAVASRPVPGGIEYDFTAVGKDMAGQPTEHTIYVLALEGEAPEFTKVVR